MTPPPDVPQPGSRNTTSAPSVAKDTGTAASRWEPDILGPGYSALRLPLGEDPDGEGEIEAVLVRHDEAPAQPQAAVLWLHGMSDYFFHTHVADRFAAEGIATFALDLRKCGRALRYGQSAHYVSDLSFYDQELDAAVTRIRAAVDAPLIVMAHSTGGLVATLWLARNHAAGRHPIDGVVLNSPWLDLDVSGLGPVPAHRVLPAVDTLIRGLAAVRPKARIPLPTSDLYGSSLWTGRGGEFDYRLALKPMGGSGIRSGWLRAVRRGHRELQAGLGLEVPVLQLRSTDSGGSRSTENAPRTAVKGTSAANRAVKARTTAQEQRPHPADTPGLDVDTDLILDVASMRRFGPSISSQFRDMPLAGARHDVMLSAPHVRNQAFDALFAWMEEYGLMTPQQ